MKVPYGPRTGSTRGDAPTGNDAGGYWDTPRGGPPIFMRDRTGVVAGHRHKFYDQPFAGRSRDQEVVLNAGEIMTAPVTCARPEMSIRDLAKIMREENVGIVPVVGPGMRLLGLVTDRDIVMRAIVAGADRATAAEVMTSNVAMIMPKEPITNVLRLMIERRIHRVPVVDKHHRLLGIVSLDDVVNRADRNGEALEALRALAGRRGFWKNV